MGKFIMRKQGGFAIAGSSLNQCKGEGHKHFTYYIEIEAGDKLDENGFIIEHSLIDALIQSDVKKAESCENIAKFIAHSLFDLLTSEGAEIHGISVKIIPYGENITAHIEYII